MLSYYRDAELRGTSLLLRMLPHEADAVARASLTRHIADEARHAWWLTRRIEELGGAPEIIADGYQRRIGRRSGVPRTLLELYAVSLVAEERAQTRYRAHLASGIADSGTAELLDRLTADEVWHLDWVMRRLEGFAALEGRDTVDAAIARFRAVDAAVAAELAAVELEALGYAITPA